MSELIHAIEYGNIDKVRELIDAGEDINIHDDDERQTPLMYAVVERKVEIVKLLISKGAEVDMIGGYMGYPGHTPLLAASLGSLGVTDRDIEIVKLLISKGADVNIKGNEDSTPLNNASREGNIEFVKLLINAGADVNSKDEEGFTPVINASYKGYKEIVKLLIEAGADVEYIYMRELINACHRGVIDKVRELIKAGADVNMQIDGSQTPLMYAVDEGHMEVVKLLISKGADVDMIGEYEGDPGYTPLLVASFGEIEIVKLLIIKGADVNIQTPIYGLTPLYFASLGSIEIVKLLIKAGANVDGTAKTLLSKSARAIVGQPIVITLSPLRLAAAEGHTEVVKQLIEAGASPYTGGPVYDTPIEDEMIHKIYSDHVISRVKILRVKQRLAFATLLMDDKDHTEISPDIIISIFDDLNIPSIENALLDGTIDILDRALQDELSKELAKEIHEILKKNYKGKNLDDMIEVYREQLRVPNLTKQNRKAIRKKKRTRKIRNNISLGSSDMSSRESRSLNSEELQLELDMGRLNWTDWPVDEEKGKSKSKSKRNSKGKKSKGKRKGKGKGKGKRKGKSKRKGKGKR